MATREIIDIIIQERGSVKVVQAIESVGGAADRTERRVSLLQRGLRALGAAFTITEAIRAIDSYTRMENQLKILGYSQEQVADGMEKLYGIAQKSRAPYEQIVNLYGKMGQAAGELGKSEAEMLRFTELTGKALAVQGTSGNEARGVLIQITQAMGEGIVRAQEWNSMVENARPLLLAAARGMEEAGGSVSKLRQIMLDGRLTSEAFFDAVIKGGGQLDEQFARTVPTIGQGLTLVYNAMQRFLGQSGLVEAISYGLGAALKFVADNFMVLGNAAIVAGAAYATWWGAARILATVAAINGAVVAQTSLNVALGATGIWATRAGGAIKLMQAAVWGLNAAMYANPIGIVLAAGVALVGTIYMLRDSMVSFGGVTASVGSIVAEVWSRIVTWAGTVWEALSQLGQQAYAVAADMATSFGTFFTNVYNGLSTFLSNWGISLDNVVSFVYTAVNTIIGTYAGMIATIGPIIVDGIPAAFRLAMAHAINAVIAGVQIIVEKVAFAIAVIAKLAEGLPGVSDTAGVDTYFSIVNSVGLEGMKQDTEGLAKEFDNITTSIGGTFEEYQKFDYIGAGVQGVKDLATGFKELGTNVMTARRT